MTPFYTFTIDLTALIVFCNRCGHRGEWKKLEYHRLLHKVWATACVSICFANVRSTNRGLTMTGMVGDGVASSKLDAILISTSSEWPVESTVMMERDLEREDGIHWCLKQRWKHWCSQAKLEVSLEQEYQTILPEQLAQMWGFKVCWG